MVEHFVVVVVVVVVVNFEDFVDLEVIEDLVLELYNLGLDQNTN